MFEPIPGGRSIEIQGLTCWIPPQGKIWDPIEEKWIKVPIVRRSPDFAECFWEPDPRWKKLPEWEREEIKLHEPVIERNKQLEKQKKEPLPLPVHSELNKFRKEMWQYRLGGCWFYNNDEPTYITGQHWFYLSVYHLDIGLPNYREVDLEFFYAWQHAFENPKCYGIVEVTKRRNGKTFRAGSIALELTTRCDNFNSGIQSKNDTDAKKVFSKAIIRPFRKLPSFFRPKSNMTAKGAPAADTGLKFIDNSLEFDEDNELASMIDAQPSGESNYDGQKLRFYLADETGKTKLVDVYDRLRAVLPCLEDENNNIIGKTIHTTTVEDMGPDNTAFTDLWNESDQHNLRSDGTTISGLFRLFFAADRTRDLDKYGKADREAARKAILARREGKDPRAQSQEMRKNPLTVEEAFQIDASKCVFNPLKLIERRNILQVNEHLPHVARPYRRGNFYWKNFQRDGEVYWKDDENGRFLMAWEPPEAMRNLKIHKGNRVYPGNKAGGGFGVDPFDHIILSERGQYTMSLGGIVAVKRENQMDNSPVEGGPCLIYLDRPDNPEIFYEDAIMACHYYGWQANIEKNKPGCVQYFQDRGYEEYVYTMPNATTPGISASARSKGGGTNALIAEITAQFIEEYIDRVVFVSLIEQWQKFTPIDTTKFDLAMAFGYAYMLVQRISVKERKRGRRTPLPLTSYLPYVRKKRGLLR